MRTARHPVAVRLPALAALTGLATLVLGGCDADLNQTDDHDAQPDVVRAGLVDLYAGDATDPAPADVLAEGGCFADALLDAVSLDELVAAEVVDDKGQVVETLPVLDVDVAGAWVDAFTGCVDYRVAAARGAGLAGDLDAAAFLRCLDAAVPPGDVPAALVDTLTGRSDSAAATALLDAQDRCATA
ncbi:hypothetical protein FE634_20395 [Nocardioides dongxiaopingii]|uniref:hypothetical protein n=1 Tax=Nocardioides sp. S-1144 TaxID=2582905 RepID=UPI00110E0338|nr:hypothetical protein [Nocardioides sp. S-1144]QCW52194.1 hypothetical protein FE634_20395 [Nocardioides sp. S-1144]